MLVSTIEVRRSLTWSATYALLVHRLVRHPGTPLAVFTAAAAVTMVGTFLPWLRSGSTSRSSYDLLGVLARLDVAPHGAVSTLVHWWPVVPLLITSAVVAAWWRWNWAAVAAAVVSALYAGGVGLAMMVASRGTGIGLGPGPWVCVFGGFDLLMAALWLTVTSAIGRDAAAPHATARADRS
ncbi:MAG: hypothetical protein JWN99_1804 [Ilumatobacteraceae bacterium]|nr:hypothetical protein [Ilumatobacteraceae bacterium]